MANLSILFDIGILIVLSALLANLARTLKQPLILGYVFTGIFLGPLGLSVIRNLDLISTISELGITFLLFIVGLELDLKKFREIGSLIFITGALQVLFTFAIGFGFASIYFGVIEATYIGLILAFSSTMIVIKLLSDKSRLETLHGRIILGILLVQDVLVVIALPILSTFGNLTLESVAISIFKGFLLFVVALFANRFIFYYVLRITAKIQELLFVSAISVCFLFAGLAYYLGFSIAIGAFLAGVSLASFPYNLEIVGRIKSLKDFFSVLFFASLGVQLVFDGISSKIPLIIGLILITLIIKPTIVFIILKLFGHQNRTAFISGLSLAQISEFSLVIAALGISFGAISTTTFSITIIVALVTITLTSYFIGFDEKIFSLFSKFLVPIEKKTSKKDLENLPQRLEDHVVLIGAHRMGSRIIKALRKKKENFIVVDFNPEIIKNLIRHKVHSIYGDLGNIDILESLHLDKAKVVISTIPSTHEDLLLIRIAKEKNKKIIVFTTAKTIDEALTLYHEGADFVVLPEMLAGDKLADYLSYLDAKSIRRWGNFYYKRLLKDAQRSAY